MSQFISYKNIPIHFLDVGNGKAIVLLHGFLEHSFIWKDIIPEISVSHRVVCVDLLGHGKTGCLGEVHSMEDMACAVDAVLRHLKIKQALFFGHSMGGYVALAIADLFPEYVKGMGLINSTPLADSFESQQNRERAIIAVQENARTFIKIAITNLFAKKNHSTHSDAIHQVIQEAVKTPVQGITAALKGMKIRKDRTNILKMGTFKKLIVIGLNDAVINHHALMDVLENVDIEILEFPDGHMSYIENKSELSFGIVHFIENI